MGDFVVVNRGHDFSRCEVARMATALDLLGVNIEATSFMDEVNDGQSGEEGTGSFGGGLPEACSPGLGHFGAR